MIKLLFISSLSLFLISSALVFSEVMTQSPDATKQTNVTITNDDKITTDVKNAISSDKAFAAIASQINVKSNKGIVTLSGTVDNEKDKLALADKAKGTPGVIGVLNKLEVQSETLILPPRAMPQNKK